MDVCRTDVVDWTLTSLRSKGLTELRMFADSARPIGVFTLNNVWRSPNQEIDRRSSTGGKASIAVQVALTIQGSST
jgi:hypothetical protein